MKKIILFILLFSVFVSDTSAYNISEKQQKIILNLKEELYFASLHQEKSWFEENLKKIDKNIAKNKNSPEKLIILFELKKEFIKLRNENFPEFIEKVPDTNEDEKNEIKKYYKDFFTQHGKNITTKLQVPAKCREFYKEIDEIWKKYDFPTPLIIATWWKETNCWLSNPKNGWWPFQITSTYHTPWVLTFAQFEKKVIQYIEFSRGKIASYEKNATLKKRFKKEKINISYYNFSLSDLQLYAVLYNGAGKTTDITKNTFANANLNTSLTSNSDGLVTRFLKIIHYQSQR